MEGFFITKILNSWIYLLYAIDGGSEVIKRETREKARQLRREGWSVSEIKDELGVSKGSVSLWVRDIQLTEEQQLRLQEKQRQWAGANKGAQANRQRALKKRQHYQEEGRQQARQSRFLHMAGCMLYWAEGAKTRRNRLQFANSDPHMLTFFMRFLREEMEIDEAWVRLQIHCHSHDPAEHERIKRYWTDLLNLPLSCVWKVQVKKGSDTRKNRLENGICALQVMKTRIVQHIFGAIQEYGGFENPEWLL